MSSSMSIETINQIFLENKNFEKLLEEETILYSMVGKSDSIYSQMEKGYQEMAALNLEYAEFGSDNLAFNDYVNWLSGEWFKTWQ